MNFAEPGIQSQLDLLERRLRRAERWSLLNRVGWTITVVAVLIFLWTDNFGVAQAQSQKLRLRKLAIVDEQGRERIIIAAPLPDPLVNGKQEHRVRAVSAAVQFKAANGNEQGGIAVSDDGSFLFGIDDELGRERAHLYYLPKRGSGVFLQGENGKETVSLLVPQKGGAPKEELTDASGKSIALLPLKTP